VLFCEEFEGFDVTVVFGGGVLFSILTDGTVLFHVVPCADEVELEGEENVGVGRDDEVDENGNNDD
jgi:hypothetical protein